MTEKEKKTYIDNDFNKRVRIPCGDVPNNILDARVWWNRCKSIWNDWLERYKDNSESKYAVKLWNEYMDSVEMNYRKVLRGN